MAVVQEDKDRGLEPSWYGRDCESGGGLELSAFWCSEIQNNPRFGFQPASRFRLHGEYDVPDEMFMGLDLVPGAFSGTRS